jgi:hypothetical protein
MKPQRFKVVMKDGKPTGQVRQTNKGTQGAATKVTHGLIKKITGKK